jgi:hypothetical protein
MRWHAEAQGFAWRFASADLSVTGLRVLATSSRETVSAGSLSLVTSRPLWQLNSLSLPLADQLAFKVWTLYAGLVWRGTCFRKSSRFRDSRSIELRITIFPPIAHLIGRMMQASVEPFGIWRLVLLFMSRKTVARLRPM